MLRRLLFVTATILFLTTYIAPAEALTPPRKTVTNWYFHEYYVTFNLTTDSTMRVVEKIRADIGTISNKHGIFKVLPTMYRNGLGRLISSPITLQSITDFEGKALPYAEQNNWSDHTISWQIGDKSTEVKGINDYEIKYQVDNVIQMESPEYDVWKWNIMGSFWNLETDNFIATINLPPTVSEQNTQVTLYRGATNSMSSANLQTKWISPHQLTVTSTKTLQRNEGITVELQVSKGVFTPYAGGFWFTYSDYLPWVIPLLALLVSFTLWFRYGRDARSNRAIVVEYSPPENMSATEMGLLLRRGNWKNSLVSPNIMNLAVKGYIRIQVKKFLFWTRDLTIESTMDEKKRKDITVGEMNLLQDLISCRFMNSPNNGVSLADLRLNFPQKIKEIEERMRRNLVHNKYIAQHDFSYGFWVVVILLGIAAFICLYLGISSYMWALFVAAIIVGIFAPFMYQLTPEGALMLDRIKGFRLFMAQVEKYRQQFFEREGSLMDLLPYAMVFGLTQQWLLQLKNIVTVEQWSALQLSLASSLGSIDNISSTIDSISHSISSSIASSSGAGVGSGGGGGGGGGW